MITTYNGWTNRETWLVKLWIDNELATQEHVPLLARNATVRGASAMASSPAALLADDIEEYVREWVDESTNDLDGEPLAASLASDLLSGALARVDWYEIAEAYLEED